MSEFFLKIVNMSISASWIVLAVLLLRLLFKKAPKWITVLLWGVVAVKLLCPFSIESVLSLIPSAETISPEIMMSKAPEINTGVPIINEVVNPIIYESFAPNPSASANPLQILIPVFAIIWLIGIAGMLIYTAISYIRLKNRIGTAVLLKDNVFQSEKVGSPFVLGVINPKIYLPFNMSTQDTEHVIAHENAHIRRKDHLWKPLGFLLLTVHWFNPLMWLAYVFLCRDIELACDEKVIKDLNTKQKADYSAALLSCSVKRRMIAACPLAFGEVGVKKRVKSVLSYKKPAFWLIVAAVIASVAAAVCFLTNPKENGNLGISSQTNDSELNGVSLEIVDFDASAPDPYIEIKWTNDTDKRVVFGSEFQIFYSQGGTWENCSIEENPVWNLIAYYVEANSTTQKTYKLNGQMMSLVGKYRFEAPFTVDNTKYKAWVEFEIEDSVESITSYTFKPIKLVYDDWIYSFVQTIDIAPTYMLVNGMQLAEKTDGNVSKLLGTFEEITLNENTFDSRFRNLGCWWYNDDTLESLKNNNKRIWQLYGDESAEIASLYILLEQNDGTFYIGEGYYNVGSNNPANPDDSHIRWLYKLKADTADIGAVSDTIPLTSLNELKKKYPHFFGLSTDGGLTVYIWQMAAGSYRCSLISRKDAATPSTSTISIHASSATLDEMRIIVADYRVNKGVDKSNINIRAIRMPISSYYYEINDEYEKNLSTLFWSELPIVENTQYKLGVIDTARFDIDGDGKDEDCTLSFGPTSGLFTFVFSAYEDGKLEYFNIFNSPWIRLHFERNAEGEMMLAVENTNESYHIGIEVRDGNIVLLSDDDGLWYWGTQGVDSPYAPKR